tara:strand:- start:129 stop:548 length:420 start_codon:yes stop_codon:yes gene_type:complete
LTRDISEKDKKDWENFLSKKEKLPNKDLRIKSNSSPKVKSIDLHGFTLEQANSIVKNFINKSLDQNVNKLIVVTGKGIHSEVEKDPYASKDLSILKFSVPEFIKNNKDLMKNIIEIKEADILDGGSGAFYIYLKKAKNK